MGGNDGDFGDCCSNDGKSGSNGNTSGYNQSTVILETNGIISKYIGWSVCSPTF